MNEQYRQRVQAMEREIEISKLELEDSRIKLESFEKQGTDKQKLEKEYKRKVKSLQLKVTALEKKQNDSVVVNAFKDKGEKKLLDMEGNIERLRNQYESMSKKLKDESDLKIKLEQELARGVQKITELELKTQQQKKLLKRRTEDVVAAHKKLRSTSNASDQ